MRKVLALGAAVLFIGSVGVAGAQERLPQSSIRIRIRRRSRGWRCLWEFGSYVRPLIGPHSSIGLAKPKPCLVAFSRSIYPVTNSSGNGRQLARRRPCGDRSHVLVDPLYG